MKTKTHATIGLVIAAIMTAGCAGYQWKESLERHEALLRVAVQYATLRVLAEQPKYAEKVIEVASWVEISVKADAEAGVSLDIVSLEIKTRERIPWQKLTPEEFILVDALVTSVRVELERAVEDLDLPDTILQITKVMGWIRSAAELTQREA